MSGKMMFNQLNIGSMIKHAATGKVLKNKLREQFQEHYIKNEV